MGLVQSPPCAHWGVTLSCFSCLCLGAHLSSGHVLQMSVPPWQTVRKKKPTQSEAHLGAELLSILHQGMSKAGYSSLRGVPGSDDSPKHSANPDAGWAHRQAEWECALCKSKNYVSPPMPRLPQGAARAYQGVVCRKPSPAPQQHSQSRTSGQRTRHEGGTSRM